MSLLSVATSVLDEIGVTAPAMIVDNPDLTAKRVLACANTEGQWLYRAHNWSILHRVFEFSTANGVDNYALPGDWGRPIGETAWDATQFWRLRGNSTPQKWEYLRNALVSPPGLRFYFRIISGPLAGSILLAPTPSDERNLVIEYVSSFWAEDTNTDGKSSFTADSDDIRVDHELFRIGLLWRVRRSLGMPHASERNDALMLLRDAIKADIAMPTFNVVPREELFPVNIPDGNFPGP